MLNWESTQDLNCSCIIPAATWARIFSSSRTDKTINYKAPIILVPHTASVISLFSTVFPPTLPPSPLSDWWNTSCLFSVSHMRRKRKNARLTSKPPHHVDSRLMSSYFFTLSPFGTQFVWKKWVKKKFYNLKPGSFDREKPRRHIRREFFLSALSLSESFAWDRSVACQREVSAVSHFECVLCKLQAVSRVCRTVWEEAGDELCVWVYENLSHFRDLCVFEILSYTFFLLVVSSLWHLSIEKNSASVSDDDDSFFMSSQREKETQQRQIFINNFFPSRQLRSSDEEKKDDDACKWEISEFCEIEMGELRRSWSQWIL